MDAFQEFQNNSTQGLSTLLSIILGAALAVLLERLRHLPGEGVARFTRPVSVLFMIIGSYYYFFHPIFISASVLKVPVLIDQVALPFLLGGALIASCFYFGNQQMFLRSVTAFFVFGFVLFGATWLHVECGANVSDPFAKQKVALKELMLEETGKNVWAFAAMAVISGASSWGAQYKNTFSLWLFILLASIFLISLAVTEVHFLPMAIEQMRSMKTTANEMFYLNPIA
jgi:hypothetical protein